MGAVGLLYVGAVLLVNGLMLLEVVPARSAAILNLFVGALQCVLPTALLIQAAGDPAAVLAASGLYLFGFTYLYVGIGTFLDSPPQGLGWFSGFVAVAALVYAAVAFTRTDDPVSGVIWLAWAVLWSLFFLVLALGREQLTRVTGWALILLSQPTCSLPAFLMLTGNFHPTAGLALVWAAGLAAALALAWLLGSPSRTHRAPQPAYH
ncbi:AmiS/UreI family transporter [Nocardia farcinica]|uniref:Putative transporter n=1 Tax=Nocardia farcinica (strain IFM 10152) TaxID=247156 RepID=Q5Z1T9_NOCFA|nr:MULTISPECIES: AmiS/UreI family transporter [Nocardia]MBF6187423.1 AmiS/UreI family transporter [Nocardia farcinica]MBF6247349.1 AmiS/UreI family transporter [Nocardia elegans]MBF6262911.1 AmiS/UreI family transporter [Nocardia farcinica]MBF6281415.1 AmiS/UreI family transporter [Nocardia farcinica]MBF6292193.1 AmiS/UreI family transporter [Nocardia farcinica]